MLQPVKPAGHVATQGKTIAAVEEPPVSHALPDLRPARWIWFPSGRTLANSFLLFRHEVQLQTKPVRATGWVCADSRYRFEVNGRRIQWGPAPSDPRWTEADPLDLTEVLQPGKNVLGATVLFYGEGDGTSPLGRPGFLFCIEVEYPGGRREKIVSDARWQTMLCRAWRPGRPKRWYLRSLQEEFDARLYPYGWSQPEFVADSRWIAAMELDGSPNQPSLCTDYPHYTLDLDRRPEYGELRPRSIELMHESMVAVAKLSESYRFDWIQPAEDYFDFCIPNAYHAERGHVADETTPGEWTVDMSDGRAAVLTFELAEQMIGWPRFTIDAPEGTVIEMLVHEAHAPDGPPLLNTHFNSWTRFICREGKNEFEEFDFESLRWLQLHIRNTRSTVRISGVQVRRRRYPWAHEPQIRTSDPELSRLFSATVNTLVNCAQETLVDGMARERQQYSEDVGQQIHALHLACGERRQVNRYVATWSQGLSKDGYFLDAWPAYDRIARIFERELDLTRWAPLLDHGIGFNFDCLYHYQYTGDLKALQEPYPRLIRFAGYLESLVQPNGLLPVENIGIPTVWLDHVAYEKQSHKQCAFNLYAAAMLEHALAPLCRAFGNSSQADAVTQFGRRLKNAATRAFWSARDGRFVNNLPWIEKEGAIRTCDRSLAVSILYNQCPGGQIKEAVRSLVECPPEMGLSYPANACWRLWALAKVGRGDVIVTDLRKRWAPLDSVRLNNSLQEDWHVEPDSASQWSHCPVVPLYIAFQGLMGLQSLEPGFRRYELRPQLGDLPDLDLTAYTVKGEIAMAARRSDRGHLVTFHLPDEAQGELVVPADVAVDLPPSPRPAPTGHRRLLLPAGKSFTFPLARAKG